MGVKQFAVDVINSFSNVLREKNVDYFSNVDVYHCESTDITHISSSNNIMMFVKDGKKLFFKECRCHTSMPDYINMIIFDYFELVLDDENQNEIKKIILSDLREKNNQRLFAKLPNYVMKNYGSIRTYDYWDTAIIGLPSVSLLATDSGAIRKFLKEYFPKFLEYARNDLEAYRMNGYVGRNRYHTFRSSLSIATRKLAQIYELGEMIPNVCYAKIIINGKIEKYGTIMEEALGRCSLELRMEDKKNITPEFQRQLIILNLFDVICFQRDHKQENYFVSYDFEGKAERVYAFDNDYPLAFCPLPIVTFDTCIRCSPFIREGKINRPYLDRGIVEKIQNTSFNIIQESLKTDLSRLQIFSLKLRIKKIVKAIKENDGEHFSLLNFDEWNEETIFHEIHGNFGNTYLKHYIECDENALVAELMNGQ